MNNRLTCVLVCCRMMESCLSYKADKREQAEEQVDCLKRGLSSDVSTSPDSQVNLVATGQFTVMLVTLLPNNDRAITIHVTWPALNSDMLI